MASSPAERYEDLDHIRSDDLGDEFEPERETDADGNDRGLARDDYSEDTGGAGAG